MSKIEQVDPYWAVVPAAGTGLRMSAQVPKQYLKIEGKTIFEYTIESLLKLDLFKRIVICVHQQDDFYQHIDLLKHPKVICVQGGKTRAHSVLNGLKFLSTKAQGQDWVMVHDVVRPCLDQSDVFRLVEQLKHDKTGGILATPVRDTMKRTSALGSILKTESREQLWHAMTPQLFRFQVLNDALTYCLQKQLSVTDESSAVEQYGKPSKVIQAQGANLKITYPSDLRLASLMLK